ncbi:G-protein coupled receptor family C group 5 member C-like [Rhinophrynus dorsalis]
MAALFHSYYSALYNLTPSTGLQDLEVAVGRMKEFLQRAGYPGLPPEVIAKLEEPFTLADILEGIKQITLGKSPGPDGILAIYYKKFSELLAPHMLRSFNGIAEGDDFPKQALQAHITLIPKPDKDLTQCTNYRPISLVNIDTKLFASLWATRLKPFLERLIHPSQAGFVPKRETRDHTVKALTIIHKAMSNKPLKMSFKFFLLILGLMNLLGEVFTQNITTQNITTPSLAEQNISNIPAGCGLDVQSIFFPLCDLNAAWGIIIETVAGLGIICTLGLAITFLVLAPSVTRDERKGALAINFMFLIGVFGLFSLVFAFVIAPNAAVCSVRRFLFGVLFAMCFACLVAHSVRLNYLVLQNRGPGGCLVFLLALGLFLVEAVINMEWLLITNVRHRLQWTELTGNTCNIDNQDFVTALVYVMFLILASLVIPCPVLCGHYLLWKRHGKYIVVTSLGSVIIWVIWIVMYIYGNEKLGKSQAWDDPVLAITLLSNGWIFVLCYIIPELVEMTSSGYGYESESLNIMKRFDECQPSIVVENRAFSMENLGRTEHINTVKVQDKPVSPYSSYSGIYPTLPLYPTEVETVNHIPLPRISMEPWRYHL